jgi:hypothetical protein
MVHAFDGEALSAIVHAQPDQEELRLELLSELVARAQVETRRARRRATIAA